MMKYEQKVLLYAQAVHNYHDFLAQLRRDYENELTHYAFRNTNSVSAAATTTTTTSEGIQLPATLTTEFKYMPDSPMCLLRSKVKRPLVRKNPTPLSQKNLAGKAAVRRLLAQLSMKKPVTELKLLTLMNKMNIPVEKYAAIRVEELLRKYFGDALTYFNEKTFNKHFFNNTPPFKMANTVGITWEEDMRGMLSVEINSLGLVVRKPTERLEKVVEACGRFVDSAFEEYDTRQMPDITREETFLRRVTRFNKFTTYINNISATSRYNSSSLILYYFVHLDWGYDELQMELVSGSEFDVEEVALKRLLNNPLIVRQNVDQSVQNPYNVVQFAGYAYDQIRGALRAEYVLLKLLFVLARLFHSQLTEYTNTVYQSQYGAVMAKRADSFELNNVLQLCPGLLTIIFFLLGKDRSSVCLSCLDQMVEKIDTLLSVKNQAGRQEAIEMHKSVSWLVERAAGLALNALEESNNRVLDEMRPYVNVLFLRSGFIRQQ